MWNRARAARFLADFAGDGDVRDLLLLDLLAGAVGAPARSTGAAECDPSELHVRLWEYTWLYQTLGLENGDWNILNIGGPASPLALLAALAGNHVTSLVVIRNVPAGAHLSSGSLDR